MHGKHGGEIQTKMSIYNQPNLTSGIDDALVTTAESVPEFTVMLLLFVFIMVFVGGTSNQKRRIGTADYPFWGVMAGLATTFLSLLLTLGRGMINPLTLGIVVAVTIMMAVWFFLSTARGEQ